MQAAKLNRKTWGCDHCTNLKLKAVRQKMRYILPYYQLMAEIYPEFKKKYEPAMTIFNVEV
jgi:predicted nucleic acid-binding Zn finger protein